MNTNKEKTKNELPRPPIVVVMGHVDHGKTTLLDNIKKTNVAGREAGGITQSIGAYEIIHTPTATDKTQTVSDKNGKKITFIDTPGHEAFSKMRARGAKVADLAILIVAADDGIQPQTKESIEILKNTNTPFIVAINKIDKPNADVEKTKNDLTQNGVYLEGYGGNVSWQAISAKQGTGVSELLDLILLVSEIENLTYDPNANASGIIIESKLDPRRGITAIGIVKNGTLKNGKGIVTTSACGKIRILENFLGERVDELQPSSPALILGFNFLPQIGEEFTGGDIEITPLVDIHAAVIPKIESLPPIEKYEDKRPVLNVIAKADVSGSLEALLEILKNLPQENVRINILSESVGEITDGDVKAAIADNSIIIGFNTKTNKSAEVLTRAQNAKIITSKIIYELVKAVEGELKKIETPPPLGELEVLATFSHKNKEQLVGGKVLCGMFKKNIVVKILRNEEEIGTGRIKSLQHFKQEVNQALESQECGIIIESPVAIAVGDHLIYTQKEIS